MKILTDTREQAPYDFQGFATHGLLSKYLYEIEQRFKQENAARGETARKTKAGGNHGATL